MKVMILGAGLSGLGAAKLMQQQGHDVTLVNQNKFESTELESLGIHCVFSDDVSVNDGTYDVLIKAPGIVDAHPLVQSFDFAYNEIEWAYHYSSMYHYYAISGTNGKTTTTMILHQMLQEKDKSAILAGNVGIALSEMVYEKGNHECDVALEISGFQIDGLKDFHAKAFGLLNLSPDHLDHYKTEEEYYNSKLNLIDHCDVFIRNVDDANILRLTKKTEHTLDLSLNHEADIYLKDRTIYFKDTVLFHQDDLKVVGRHNLYNASLAATLGYLAGVSPLQIQEVLRNFKAVEHRCEYVDTIDGVQYYNDSKATNPESVAVCLESFEDGVYLLAGGHDKNISFDLLKDYDDHVKHAYLFGNAAQRMSGMFTHVSVVETMDETIALAAKQAQAGDVVLLSPACSSYDQYKNFEERGNHFKALVKNMKD